MSLKGLKKRGIRLSQGYDEQPKATFSYLVAKTSFQSIFIGLLGKAQLIEPDKRTSAPILIFLLTLAQINFGTSH